MPSLTSPQIGIILAYLGGVQLVFQIFLYPSLEKRIGLVNSFKFATIFMALACFALPFSRDFALTVQVNDSLAQVLTVFVSLLTIRIIKTVFGYISVLVLVNNSCSDEAHLGLVHGFGHQTASLVRAIGPALAGVLWSWSLMNGLSFPVDYHFSFLFAGLISIAA